MWHITVTIVLKRRVSQVFVEGVTTSVCARLVPFSSSIQTRKRCISERKQERGRVTVSLPLCHFPGHELFNGFSHLCVWGDMICIHPTVTGTTWGGKPMERLLMCKHHIIPALPPPPPPPPSHSRQALMSHLQPQNDIYACFSSHKPCCSTTGHGEHVTFDMLSFSCSRSLWPTFLSNLRR